MCFQFYTLDMRSWFQKFIQDYNRAQTFIRKKTKENPDKIGTHFFLLITKDTYYADLDAKLVMYDKFKKKFPSGFHIEYIDRRLSELKKEKFMKEGVKVN